MPSKQIYDKFFTNQQTVKQVLEHLNLENYDLIIEPSAGNGSFLRSLPKSTLAFDLVPERRGILKMNWLEAKNAVGGTDPSLYIKDKQEVFCSNGEKVLVVGNPPFGANSQLAADFVKESAKIADTIAFVMPLSFRKASQVKRLPNNFEVVINEPVKNNKFVFWGKQRLTVPSTILILKRLPFGALRKDTAEKQPEMFDWIPRRYAGKVENGALFLNEEAFDAMIVRVGGRAGQLVKKAEITKNGFKYNYFIKIKEGYSLDDLEARISERQSEIREIANQTTGARSLSMAEIVAALN